MTRITKFFQSSPEKFDGEFIRAEAAQTPERETWREMAARGFNTQLNGYTDGRTVFLNETAGQIAVVTYHENRTN